MLSSHAKMVLEGVLCDRKVTQEIIALFNEISPLPPLPPVPPESIHYKTEYIEITDQNILNGGAFLSETPDEPDEVTLTVMGGCEQQITLDFNISGNFISWMALGLDTVIAASDTICVSYTY